MTFHVTNRVSAAMAALFITAWAAVDARAVNLIAAADYYGSETGADTPTGTGTGLSYRLNTSGTTRHDIAAMRFDISSLSGVVTAASLQLTPNSTKTGAPPLNLLGVYESVAGLWDESTITYNNAPWLFPDGELGAENGQFNYDRWDLVPNDETDITNMLAVELQGTAATAGLTPTPTLNQTYSFTNVNVANFLQQAINNGDDSVTFLVASRSTTLYGVYSKDAEFENTTAGVATTTPLSDAYRPNLELTIVDAPPPLLSIDRNTGAIILSNEGVAFLNIKGYSISSTLGALDPSSWLTVDDNYDSNHVSPNQIDSDDEWTVLTTPDVEYYDFSEFEFGGDGGTIAPGASVVLSTGGGWIQTPNETDLVAEISLVDGTILNVPIEYTGNGGNPLVRSDLNADGSINSLDWNLFRNNHPADLSSLTLAQAYGVGDVDGDGDNDSSDFLLFRSDYNTANGSGSFAAMVQSVPEPSGIVLCLLAGLVVAVGRFSRLLRSVTLLTKLGRACIFLVTLCAVLGSSWLVPKCLALNLIVTEDTYIAEGTAAPEDPATADIRLRYSSIAATIRNQVILLKFDLTGIDSRIFSANLNLTSTRDHGPNYSMNLFGAFEADAGNWTQATTHWYNSPLLFPDDPDNLNVEESDFIYDRWDLVPNGDTTGANLKVRELIGTTAAGVTFGGSNIDADDKFTFSSANIAQFLEEARTNGDQSATFVITTRTESTGEFRLYDLESAPNSAFTPNLDLVTVAESPRITVNTNTGEIRFVNPTAQAIDFAQYQIDSPLGRLLTGDSDWLSLHDQNLNPVNGGDDPGETWEESGQVGPGVLSELFLLGSSTVGAGQSISFGNAYNHTLSDDENMTFQYFDIGLGQIVTSPVELIAPVDVDGDYNSDGIVNAADYVMWRDNPTGLGGNPTGYNTWRANFGASNGAGAGASTAVPEPSAILLFLAGVGMMLSRWSTRRALTIFAALALIALPFRAIAATDDRFYRLGDNPDESAFEFQTLGSAGIAPGFTLDSEGPSGAFVDIAVLGSPTYADVTDRPGAAAAGSSLGASFGGPGNGQSLQTNISMSSPDNMWDNTLFFPGTPHQRNYTGILAHGIQLWAKPNSVTQGVRQDLVIDTPENGIFITDSNKWGLQFDDLAINSGTAVEFDTWTHVMQVGGINAPVAGNSRAGGVLFVNGVAVAANAGNYEDSETALSIGANQAGDNNFYHGLIDDVHMFLWGDNSSAVGPPAGMDYGTFNLAEDNEWIANQLATLGVTDVADVNLDSNVNDSDIIAFVLGWKSKRTVNGIQIGDWTSRQAGDLNWDGIVDIRDAVILDQGLSASGAGSIDFGKLLSGGYGVPEPSSWALLAVGVLFVYTRCKNGRLFASQQ